MKRLIAVIGGRRAPKALLEEAERAGRLIARSGAVLICGGLGGVMEAASKGAYLEGGITVGILPFESKEHANQYIIVPIATGLGLARNAVIAQTSDAIIAIGGEYGTLSEIAFAIQMGKPVIGIRTWGIERVIDAKDAEDAVSKALESIK